MARPLALLLNTRQTADQTRAILALGLSVLMTGSACIPAFAATGNKKQSASPKAVATNALPTPGNTDVSRYITPVSELMQPDNSPEHPAVLPAITGNDHTSVESLMATPQPETTKPKVTSPLPIQALPPLVDHNKQPQAKPAAQAATQSTNQTTNQTITQSTKALAPADTPAVTHSSVESGDNTTANENTEAKHTRKISAENLQKGVFKVEKGMNSAKKRVLDTVLHRADPNHTYTAVPAIAIFPVVRHGYDKAFSDLPVLLANEFALKLEASSPGSKVLNPVYTIDGLKLRGYDRIYQQLMDYYVRAGRPEPRALNFMLNELSKDGTPVHRVIFVEADVDYNRPTVSYNPVDRIKQFMRDDPPEDARYYVRSHVKVFDTLNPEQREVWDMSWALPVKARKLYNVNPSVYKDADSLDVFGAASRTISKIILTAAPQSVYMHRDDEIRTNVQGQIVSSRDNTDSAQNQNSTTSTTGNLSNADKASLEKLLKANP